MGDPFPIVAEKNSFLLVRNKLDIYNYNNSWDLVGSLKGDKGDKFEINYIFNSINDIEQIDYIIEDTIELINYNEDGKFILVKNSLKLYYRENGNWNLIGQIKGEKGDKGDKGNKGDKGDKGDGIKINYYFDNHDEIYNSNINYNNGDIIYVKDTNELKFYDNSFKDLGNLTLNEFNFNTYTLENASETHQDIKLNRLKEIKFDFTNKYFKNLHKISLLFCWKLNG